jgi:hypothetical protein
MPDGSGGGGEGSGNQYGGGDRNGGGNNGGFSQAQFGGESQAPAPAPAPSGDSSDSSATGGRDTDSGLSAVSPFAAFSQVTRSPEQQAFFDRHVGATAARDAYSEAYRTLQEQGPVSPLDQAKLIKDYVKTTEDKWTKPATKNSEAVEHNDLKFTISPGDLTGRPLDRQVLKALSAVGLGGVYGVHGNENQSAENVVAAQNVDKFITTTIDIAKNFMPGYGVAMFAANLLSGKMTVGQAFASVVGDKVAGLLGVPAPLFRSLLNAEAGNGVAGVATNALNSYIAGAAKIDPRITGTFLSKTPLSSTLRSSLSALNGGPNIGGAVAGTVDSGLSKLGFTGFGGKAQDTSGNIPYTGTDTQSQVDNILNPSGIKSSSPSSSSAPSSAPAATGNISSAGPSSGSYAGALSSMPTLGSTSGLYRVGNTNYTPYSQDLGQLNLAADEFTKQSDIGNIPVYNTDIAKMASSPFTQASDPYSQYAAAGGSIRHFSGEEGSHVTADAPAGGTPAAPTADQLEKRAALQAQADYYKNLDTEKQNADIMSALKNLSGVGAAEAKPQSSPLIRLGQVGNYTPPKVLPQLAALLQSRGMRLAEGGQPDDHSHPNYDGTPVFRTGGLSGLGGKYVEGKGDGTSDDITAMLADGEYVFSADVVSALGNGSNKAGAQVLDKTVEAIRSRARSAPPDKLPPDAKSPLEYMQAVKGKKYG